MCIFSDAFLADTNDVCNPSDKKKSLRQGGFVGERVEGLLNSIHPHRKFEVAIKNLVAPNYARKYEDA